MLPSLGRYVPLCFVTRVLYCIVLYCTVLYCIVLYCIVLYCIVLHYVFKYYVVIMKCLLQTLEYEDEINGAAMKRMLKDLYGDNYLLRYPKLSV